MSFHIEQPFYFLLILILFPVGFLVSIKLKTLITMVESYSGKNKKTVHSLKARLFFRTLTWSLSWVCVCIALTGPSWGTELVPVQKSGRAVSFVFDISHSMMAKDEQGGSMTRLDFSKQFTHDLLSVLPGVATSAVLAKGDGVISVPLTEDYYALSNLINSLSPFMLSHPGSSLSKGVLKAIESFPPQSARSSYIVVMSDGDDTDDDLSSAVDVAVRFGIHVIFVGFGSLSETDVLAGDGITQVKTALRAEKLQSIAQKDTVDFVLASDTNAIDTIVQKIKPSIFFSDASTTTSYEVAPINRHAFFIALAIVFFLLGIFSYLFSPTKSVVFFLRSSKAPMLLFFIISSFLFTGCTDWFYESKKVLEGSYLWTQQKYQQSVASFLDVSASAQEQEDTAMLQYGLFGLSANYIMQGEMEASLTKINEMDPNVSPSLDFARWYNKGIIFHRNGDYATAAFCFKKALLLDSSNIYAKINLELCLDKGTVQAQQGIQERIPVAEQKAPSGAADAVFSLIRENEENKWKSQEFTPEQSDIIDY